MNVVGTNSRNADVFAQYAEIINVGGKDMCDPCKGNKIH